MSEMYMNNDGKRRLADPDSEHQSALRRRWFEGFEQNLRATYPDLFRDIRIQIVGAVAKGAAASNSDIDIALRCKGSDKSTHDRARNAIFELLRKMKQAQEPTYDLEVQDFGDPFMFNAVSQFVRGKK